MATALLSLTLNIKGVKKSTSEEELEKHNLKNAFKLVLVVTQKPY